MTSAVNNFALLYILILYISTVFLWAALYQGITVFLHTALGFRLSKDGSLGEDDLWNYRQKRGVSEREKTQHWSMQDNVESESYWQNHFKCSIEAEKRKHTIQYVLFKWNILACIVPVKKKDNVQYYFQIYQLCLWNLSITDMYVRTQNNIKYTLLNAFQITWILQSRNNFPLLKSMIYARFLCYAYLCSDPVIYSCGYQP